MMFINKTDASITNKKLLLSWCNSFLNRLDVNEPPIQGHTFFMIVGQKLEFSQEQIQQMKDLHKECHAVSGVAKAFGIGHTTAKRVLEENGVDVTFDYRRQGRIRRKYQIDETFFESIDNRDKAYIFGLISADGNIHSTYPHIKLKLTDIELVEAVRDRMKYDRPLYFGEPTSPNHKRNAALLISNIKMYEDIQKLGIMKNKSYNNVYPSTINGYDADFIRGFFDGNGNVSVGWSQDKVYSEIKIVSTWDLVTGMSDVLKQNGIHTSFGKDKRTDKRIADLRIRRIKEIIKFREFIYNNLDGQLFLKRKFDKFKEVKVRREGRCL